jgi:CRISPR-associated endonuclease/helicase Cas3
MLMPGVHYYAHTLDGRPEIEWQPLSAHLWAVAQLAAKFAREARPSDASFEQAAWWAGALHDLGKYSDAFQQMLREVAAGGAKRRIEHSGHGAAFAFEKNAIDVAFAVAGHHAGLTVPRGSRSGLKERSTRCAADALALFNRATGDLCTAASKTPRGTLPAVPREMDNVALDLRIRMLTSCLVDADRLDAACVPCEVRTLMDAPRRLSELLAYVESRARALPPGTVRDARRAVLDACLAAAEWPERLLSLTVPTGGGKTLASMSFALKRIASRPDEARRVIVVIPYLSIIEQNAKVYAEAIGADAIVQHHSGEFHRETDEDEYLARTALLHKLAVENWDAPVIVTTSVRFFESLFSNRPPDLRRLHNIARSVVILDEVQTLPRVFLRAILSVLRGLAQDWGTTFVFCTATQPAFEKPDGAPESDVRWPKGTVREITPRPQGLFDQLKRVDVSWPGDGSRPAKCSWDDVAAWLAAEPRALCVVNLKEHASVLYQKLHERENVDKHRLWHLTTRMCPQHRLDILEAIRAGLEEKHSPCRVVATQLVEAGVDVDFPVVFRAMGPLDSIAQAAGRCDREGRLTAAAGHPAGRVMVFEPDVPDNRATPPGAYREATDVTRAMVGGASLSIHSTAHIRGYFNRYYQADLDPEDIEALRRRLNFPEVANRFVMIDDATRSILVPYNDEAAALIRGLEVRGDLNMSLRRQLQRFQVGLYPSEFQRAYASGAIYELIAGSDIWACDARFYSKDLGFKMESDVPLIV